MTLVFDIEITMLFNIGTLFKIRTNVIQLYMLVIYCYSIVVTKVYNTEWRYYHGMVANYCSKQA